MAKVQGGVSALGLLNPDNTDSVTLTELAEEFTLDESTEESGLADGQARSSGKTNTAEFFAHNLTAAQKTTLKGWDDSQDKIQATVQGFDYTLQWAEPSYVQVIPVEVGNGEIAGYRIRLNVTI